MKVKPRATLTLHRFVTFWPGSTTLWDGAFSLFVCLRRRWRIGFVFSSAGAQLQDVTECFSLVPVFTRKGRQTRMCKYMSHLHNSHISAHVCTKEEFVLRWNVKSSWTRRKLWSHLTPRRHVFWGAWAAPLRILRNSSVSGQNRRPPSGSL